MSVVSNFFKISMALRAVHNTFVEDYGIPYWGSYILFAFATIIFGAILGLVINHFQIFESLIEIDFVQNLDDCLCHRYIVSSKDTR